MRKDTVILYQPQVDYKPYYPCFWAPLSILAVATLLVAKGIRVILIDGNLEEHQKDRNILRDNVTRCICLGISSMIGGRHLERALDFSAFAKSLNPQLPIVFGGPLATVITEQLLTSPLVDYAVRGQGEQPMSELVDCFINGGDPSEVVGVANRDSQGNVESVFLDKNSFPPYPWHLLEVERYVRKDPYLGQRVLNYVSSQGCPYSCGYCSESAGYYCRWKALTAERTLNEILDLQASYGLEGIKFYDANFFTRPKRVLEFASGLLTKGSKLRWGASAHPRGVIKLTDDLGTIKNSGFSRFLIGAESGSQPVLDYIHKGCTIEDNLLTAELCAKYRIPTTFTFIVGIPGIDNDIEVTLQMVVEMKKIWNEFDIKIHFYAPFPGTSLFQESIEFGYRQPTTLEEWSRYDYYLIQTPWVNKREERKVRRFGDFYCEFLFPPLWFKKLVNRSGLSKIIYHTLRQFVEARCKIHFYGFPLEMLWFKHLTGKEVF